MKIKIGGICAGIIVATLITITVAYPRVLSQTSLADFSASLIPDNIPSQTETRVTGVNESMQEKLVEPLMTDRITLEPGTTRTITYTLKDADSVHLVGVVDVKGNGAILIKTEDSMAHVRGPLAGFALAYTSPHSIDWPLFFDKTERSISFENLHDDSMTIVDVELSIEYENTVTRTADPPS